MSAEAFTSLYNNMKNAFKEHFGERVNILQEEPRENFSKNNFPLILLELKDFHKESCTSTGQIDLRAAFEARIILKKKDNDNHRLLVRNIAAETFIFVEGNDFLTKNVNPSEKVNAFDDGMFEDFRKYECWVVEWEHLIRVGENKFRENWIMQPEIEKYPEEEKV